MNKFIVIYTTFKDRSEADKIVDFLIEKKLIACANFLSLEARCFWEGKVADANEIGALLKTRNENWEAAKTEIEKMHSYKIPCIIRFDVESNKSYADWIQEETVSLRNEIYAK
jgi:periplasmic divalent cation tolerance protein